MDLKKLVGACVCSAFVISGCATSSDFEKRANYHNKAGDYYDSIGQPDAAKREYREAAKNFDAANDAYPIIAELFQLFNEK